MRESFFFFFENRVVQWMRESIFFFWRAGWCSAWWGRGRSWCTRYSEGLLSLASEVFLSHVITPMMGVFSSHVIFSLLTFSTHACYHHLSFVSFISCSHHSSLVSFISFAHLLKYDPLLLMGNFFFLNHSLVWLWFSCVVFFFGFITNLYLAFLIQCARGRDSLKIH